MLQERPPPPPSHRRCRRRPPCRALLETFRRADIKAQKTFASHELDEATQASLFGNMVDDISSGVLKVHTAVADGAEQVGAFFKWVGGPALMAGQGGQVCACYPACTAQLSPPG